MTWLVHPGRISSAPSSCDPNQDPRHGGRSTSPPTRLFSRGRSCFTSLEIRAAPAKAKAKPNHELTLLADGQRRFREAASVTSTPAPERSNAIDRCHGGEASARHPRSEPFNQPFLPETTTIAVCDVALVRALVKGLLYEAGEFLDVASYVNVVRWTDEIATRPAVRRGRLVNRVWGPEDERLPERHSAADVDAVLGCSAATTSKRV